MSNPMRIPAGFTQDRPGQPLSLIGVPDPFYNAVFDDDFLYYQSGRYTVTVTGAGGGAVAGVNGAGGQITLTTATNTPATTDLTAIQTSTAGIPLVAGAKTAFIARLMLADVPNPVINVGLIQKTATPFTVSDGIYFNKPTGSTTITAFVVTGSVVKASVSLAGKFAPVNGQWFDLGFVYNGRDDLMIYAGTNLVGALADPTSAAATPDARVLNVASGAMLTSAVLAPTLAVQSGTASSKVLTVDFFAAIAER